MSPDSSSRMKIFCSTLVVVALFLFVAVPISANVSTFPDWFSFMAASSNSTYFSMPPFTAFLFAIL